jgi:hypothetical protein
VQGGLTGAKVTVFGTSVEVWEHMMDLATLSATAGLLGISAPKLFRLVKSATKKMDEKGKQRTLAERKNKIDKMVGEGILTKALRLYYSAENLKKESLAPYSFGLNALVTS